MIRKELVKNITDLRTDPISLFALARQKESPLYVFNRAEPIGVLLSWEDFETLMERFEDVSDLNELELARKTSSELIFWEKTKKDINV
ncbi:type II toxin-antitoxin system Phd/YefM family antitoxin [Patescibacteria group bacterium]|nr:type II toxin-antitoxin system Phd/YefM family antitoxin [Patescibacteria group bacterium]